jgi:uncharacterized protein YxjI
VRYIIREKFFRIAEDSVIQGEDGAPIYEVKGKIFTVLCANRFLTACR